MKVITIILILFICITSCKAELLSTFMKWWYGEESATVWPPSFCNNYDCPKYTVIDTNEDYEVRSYESCMWVSTDLSTADYEKNKGSMFWRLFNYISGENTNKTKISMTVPVLTQADYKAQSTSETDQSNTEETNDALPESDQKDESKDKANKYTMSFFLGMDQPPDPQNKEVYINPTQTMTAYVRSFNGYANAKSYDKEMKELTETLPEKVIKEPARMYYRVGYDPPYKFWNRHNEVWIAVPT